MFLLKEDGGRLLTESGYRILLEDAVPPSVKRYYADPRAAVIYTAPGAVGAVDPRKAVAVPPTPIL